MTKCASCGRELVPWQTAAIDDPAMDCGGDCLSCVRESEGGGIPASRASKGVLSKTTADVVLTDEQVAQVAALTRERSSP